tara:strand:- start:8738 stop:11080 length:2343 start_codon:yes stop_codon:yes gene_type:complete
MDEVQTALVLRMEATLTKFEKQMERSRKVANDTALANERRFKTSNDRMSKSAEDSANSIIRELDRLRMKYDPLFAASQKYERALEELNRAHKIGAISAQQHERQLEALNAEYTAQQAGAVRAAGALGRIGLAANGAGGGIQNLAYQVGDFAVQVGAGTSASMALGQQLPQLLGGFGVMGAVMGAVVAVGIPLVRVLFDTGDAGEDLKKKLDNLEGAVGAYTAAVDGAIIPTEELYEKYGAATKAAQEFLVALTDITKVESMKSLSETLSQIATQFGGLSRTKLVVGSDLQLGAAQAIGVTIKEIEETTANLRDELDLTDEAAARLVAGLEALDGAEGVNAQVEAAQGLLNLLIEMFGPIESMEGAALSLAKNLSAAGIQAAEVKSNIDRTNQGVLDMVAGMAVAIGNLDTLVDQSGLLGDNMYRAASAAWDFLSARAREKMAYETKVGGGRGADPGLFGGSASDWQKNDPGAQLAYSEMAAEEARRKAAEKATRKGSRGRKGGREKDSLHEIGQKELENLERQIEMIGKTDAQVAELTARYKLLDEAKKRGIDLDSKQAGSSQTVREQIDEQAAAIGRLTEKADLYRERAAFMDNLNQDLKDGFIDAIIEGENFGNVLADVAKMLAKAALQAALFNEGIFKSEGGGGGLFGNLLGSVSNWIFGKRAVGGPAQAGMPYLVNENTPNSEVFVPSSNGAVLNVSQAQSALRGMAGGSEFKNAKGRSDSGSMDVRVYVDDDGKWQAKVEQISGGVVRNSAPGIVAQSVSRAQASFRNSKTAWSP